MMTNGDGQVLNRKMVTHYIRPVPRDRDQAFYTFRGILPWLASRKFAVRKFQTFKHTIKDVPGQSFNAQHFDRYFANEMERKDWIEAAQKMQSEMTDEVIENAFQRWPQNFQELNAKDIISKLKSRRNNLPKFAGELYDYLAKRVDVRGTDKRELFKVERLANGLTKVEVFHVDKERNIKEKFYDRTFYKKETQEIRLFGLDNDDEFNITGQANNGILVRVIGGEGDDVINDDSKVGGFG